MKQEQMRKLSGLFSKVIQEKEQQGYAVKTGTMPNYSDMLIFELGRLERGNVEFKDELSAVSQFIRRVLWKDNVKGLSTFLHSLNKTFQYFADVAKMPLIFNFEFLIEYIRILAAYRLTYGCDIDDIRYEELIDKVILIRDGKVINEQWNMSGDMDTFIKVFDDAFNTAFEAYPDVFFVTLTQDDILSRCVIIENCDEDRFIPWPNKAQNRWNPPGKTFLYTAPKDQRIDGCPTELSGGEYICLHECRTKADTDVCFCDFKPVVNGKILDLSYNDEPLYKFRRMLDEEADNNVGGVLSVLMHDKVLFEHRDDEEFMETRIRAEMENHPTSQRVLMVSIAKQYLKGICDCIYTKVDETDADAKERAYKSFHLLANYLESKGVTGIKYPCTRLPKMNGKNIVLFNIHDATPIKGSIKRYHNEVDCS